MIKRIFDIAVSGVGLLILSPIFITIALVIVCTSRGGVFYKQTRVGRFGRDFSIYKFRTMKPHADQQGLLTVGNRDPRVTSVGYYLRKYKLDELPQLINVLIGDMSLVGPRPEVRKYVDLYSEDDKIVLSVRPGITDYASIAYRNENEILKNSENPEQTYIKDILTKKLELNKKYIREKNLFTDLRVIFETITSVFLK